MPADLRFEVQDLYDDYVEALDNFEIDLRPEFFTEECFYQVIPRENFDNDLPLATIRCESKGMLKDRVMALHETMLFEPRYLRHLVSNIRVSPESNGVIEARANYAVLETLVDEETRVLNAGRYLDKIVREDGVLKFKEKTCVFDSVLVPNSIVYPI